MYIFPLVHHNLLRHSNSHNVTDTGDEFSEVLPIHRDQDHAYRPGSCGAILDLFWVCLSRRTTPSSILGLKRLRGHKPKRFWLHWSTQSTHS